MAERNKSYRLICKRLRRLTELEPQGAKQFCRSVPVFNKPLSYKIGREARDLQWRLIIKNKYHV